MPYAKLTFAEYADAWSKGDHRTSWMDVERLRNLCINSKPPISGWAELWYPISTDEAMTFGDEKLDSVLFVDTLDEAEYILTERRGLPCDDLGLRNTLTAGISGMTNAVLLVFDELVLPHFPHTDELWERLATRLEGKGKVWCFNIPEALWSTSKRVYEDIVIDCVACTIEHSVKRARAVASGRKAAATRSRRTIPADVWKNFYAYLVASFVDNGPLMRLAHRILWMHRATRSGLIDMIRGYQAVNGNVYRDTEPYNDFMKAACVALPYLKESAIKKCDEAEMDLIDWIEVEIVWANGRNALFTKIQETK